MKAYKVFNPDWTCRGFKYEVGQTYKIEELPILCNIGFHACKNAANCFDFYSFDPKNKVAEVELLGDIVGKCGDKQATNKIRIVRELSWHEVLDIVNTGKNNTGIKNSGDLNSGNLNSGDLNSGNLNSGDLNSGDRNSGDRNSGDRNSGNLNSGNLNSGYRNSGYLNSGDLNSGNLNSGYLNSKDPEKRYVFNKLRMEGDVHKVLNSTGYEILCRFRLVKFRVRAHTGKYGDYRYMSYKESWAVFWSNLSRAEKLDVVHIPFFDADVFEQITGLDTRKYIRRNL